MPDAVSSDPLSANERAHYSRHLSLPGFGLERQLALKSAKVLLIGAGGLGCPIGLYLAAAGVGAIGVVDFDAVERSNLQRQIAHGISDIGQPKVDSLIAAMRAINPLPTYRVHAYRLTSENVTDTIAGYDLVLDGSDNFATRFLLADACYLHRVSLLQGAVYEYEAQLCLFAFGDNHRNTNDPCYRCVFQEPPSRNKLAPCAEVGVLGVVPGTTGLLMATEAIKHLTGMGSSIQGKLLRYNALTQTMRHWDIVRDTACPLCGDNPTITEIRELVTQCPSTPDADPVALEVAEVSMVQAKRLIQEGILVLDVREPFEFANGHLAQAVHIPLGQLQAVAEQRLPSKTEPILAYCHKGQRSLEAARMLICLGYTGVVSLSGGLAAWDGPVVLPV